jgi:hypothetical protein
MEPAQNKGRLRWPQYRSRPLQTVVSRPLQTVQSKSLIWIHDETEIQCPGSESHCSTYLPISALHFRSDSADHTKAER